MKHLSRTTLCTLFLLAALALPVFAERETGPANITPETTMKEIRTNPSIRDSGLYTYVYVWERDIGLLQHYKDGNTLKEVVGPESVESCAAGMNYLIDTYNNGTQITYKLYSPEEIAADKTRDHAELYYFPAKEPNAKYAMVLSGNALIYSGEMRGGVSTAWELHEKGYAVFALRYRIGEEAKDNAPIEDLGRAIQLITANAEQFGVQTEGYALLGYSSGGQITGIFGDQDIGYGRYGVPKPGVMLLAYPINDFYEAKPIYHWLLDTYGEGMRYYDYEISSCVTPDYPPTYFWYGENDIVLMLFNYWKQGPALQTALAVNGVPYYESVYRKAPHGIGIAKGTDAEGWIEDAVWFWQSQTGDAVQPAA